jgi:broad specificity phosphatase PhoE
MKRLLLVTHGQTPWNEAGRFQGHTDIGMNPRGFEQARRLAESLQGEKIAAILASDLKRAVETVAPYSTLTGLPIRTDARLRELNFGAWEGLTGPEIAVRDPSGWQRWDQGHAADFPGGETLDDLAARLRSVYDEALTSPEIAGQAFKPDFRGPTSQSGKADLHSNGATLIVAHRGAMRVMICVALGLEPMMFRRFHLDQTAITELRIYPHETVLRRFNDTHHLRGMIHAR